MEGQTSTNGLLLRTYFILGSSGFANELKSYISEILHISGNNIVFVGDAEDSTSVIEYQKRANVDPECVTILGSGKPEIKTKMLAELRGRVFRFIHPHAVVSRDTSIGEGSVIAPNAVVSPHVTIGNHVLVNTNASIGHNSALDDLSVVAPNAAIGGWCKVGERAYIGAGAIVKEHLTIGAGAMVGLGAVVTKDVPEDAIAIGNPAVAYTKKDWDERK